ncbi:MAG: hypothetical protein M3072_11450, partial [Candidatus Dormibacteraeota bacterium]|nr:hypothetical protein [Candidatus Dormibacteraeota bacterium]
MADVASVFLGSDDKPKSLLHMDPGPVWLEPRAWRTLKAAPALAAAAAAQRGRGRLTTFISVACSGAEIDAGLLGPQRAFQGKFGQIDEVVNMLRVPGDHRDAPRFLRPVDVLLMSIGGNDVGFSGTLSDVTTGRLAVGNLGNLGKTQAEIRKSLET